jgi:hypothetical protein
MFRWLIEDYRRQADQQSADADEMDRGRWRIVDMFRGDETKHVSEQKRSLAARLRGLADAYERHDQ